MGLIERIKGLQLRAMRALHAWRGTPKEAIFEETDAELDNRLVSESEEAAQREEIEDGLEENLNADLVRLQTTLRGKNGDKKAKAD